MVYNEALALHTIYVLYVKILWHYVKTNFKDTFKLL